jgi:hypothetical protein
VVVVVGVVVVVVVVPDFTPVSPVALADATGRAHATSGSRRGPTRSGSRLQLQTRSVSTPEVGLSDVAQGGSSAWALAVIAPTISIRPKPTSS